MRLNIYFSRTLYYALYNNIHRGYLYEKVTESKFECYYTFK